jgi:hypothetical protein
MIVSFPGEYKNKMPKPKVWGAPLTVIRCERVSFSTMLAISVKICSLKMCLSVRLGPE